MSAIHSGFQAMKRLDDGKVSLVEFMRSIRFRRQQSTRRAAQCPTHFAHFDPQVGTGQGNNAEDQHLIRSAN